jgi:hypothetical protein
VTHPSRWCVLTLLAYSCIFEVFAQFGSVSFLFHLLLVILYKPRARALALSLSHTHTHTHISSFLSLSLSLSLALSLSLSLTHTHISSSQRRLKTREVGGTDNFWGAGVLLALYIAGCRWIRVIVFFVDCWRIRGSGLLNGSHIPGFGIPPTDCRGFRNFTTTGRILFYNSWKETFEKLQMHCSEFQQWLIHLNTHRWVPPPQFSTGPSNFQKLWGLRRPSVALWIQISGGLLVCRYAGLVDFSAGFI